MLADLLEGHLLAAVEPGAHADDVAGAGVEMVEEPAHPVAGGIDHREWMGFYVNVGLDRLVMMRYGIDDVRLFHSADLRFLTQFR